jgi:probable HAF family extracellular repeat protein
MRGTIHIAIVLLASVGGIERVQAAPLYHVTYLGFKFANGIDARMNNKNQMVGFDGQGFEYDAGQITRLGTLGGPTFGNSPAAINDAGQIAGAYLDANFANRGFLSTNGALTDLGALPGYPVTSPSSLNVGGDVVGVSSTTDFRSSRAFLYHNGALTDLGPGGASAINKSGTVVGISSSRAVRYQNGSAVDLGNFGDTVFTSADAINDLGQIVGTGDVRLSTGGFANHPFLFESGVWRDLGLPDGVPLGEPRAINNMGQIVGNSNGSLGAINRPPFLYTGGAIYNLASLLDSSGDGLYLELAYDINDSGIILAEGQAETDTHSGYQAVLLTPVPEPSSLLLSAFAIALVAAPRERRRRTPRGSRA